MTLYRLAHWSFGQKLYAQGRADQGVRFTVQRASATLLRRKEAKAIAKRFAKLNTRMKLEAA